MRHTVLRLACLAGLSAAALSAAAVDFSLVNETTIAVPLGTTGHSFGTGGISDDGRYALFFSESDNLVAGDTNRATDLFLHDNQTGSIERVNLGDGGVEANADTLLMADLSADTRYVVFESRATNLVAAETHGTWQIYLRDRVAGTTTLVSRGLDGSGAQTGGYAPQISADGRHVVFISYDPLVANDANLSNDVYRYDRVAGTLDLISVSATGEIGNLDSSEARISADGRYVAFLTQATNLFPNDTNFAADIVLRDTVANINVNASVTPNGGPFGDIRSFPAGNAVSADGRYVLFNTRQALELGDTNGGIDGFRFDRTAGASLRVTAGAGGALLDVGATAQALSADGDAVLMEYTGDDIGGLADGYRRSYARTVSTGAVSLVKFRAGAVDPTDEVLDCDLSGDGTVAYCDSYTRNLADVDGNAFKDFFRSAVGADGGLRVSRALPGAVAATNDYSGGFIAGASEDGRYVAFESAAGNLVVGDNNGVADVFLRDRLAGTTLRISRSNSGAEATCPSGVPSITPDGRYVVFLSCGALLEPGGVASEIVQVYRYDRVADFLFLASLGIGDLACNANCLEPSISDDGNIIAFKSAASNLAPGASSNGYNVYTRRLPAGPTVRANRPDGGGATDGYASNPKISGDGRFVTFTATSTNLVAGDTNGVADVFAFDRSAGTVQRVSLGLAGLELQSESRLVDVSYDGTRILFMNPAFLCNSARGLHVRDTVSGQSECVSTDGVTFLAYTPASSAALSADGDRVAFTARLSFPPHVTTPLETVLLHDRTTHRIHRITPTDMNRDARVLDVCAAGDCLLFSSSASNLVASDPNNHIEDVFIAGHLVDNTIFADGFDLP